LGERIWRKRKKSTRARGQQELPAKKGGGPLTGKRGSEGEGNARRKKKPGGFIGTMDKGEIQLERDSPPGPFPFAAQILGESFKRPSKGKSKSLNQEQHVGDLEVNRPRKAEDHREEGPGKRWKEG